GGVALRAEQEVAAEMAVALHAADDRLDGVSPPPFAADGWGEAALLAGADDAGAVGIMAAIAAIDIGALDFDAGDALGLGDLGGKGVAIIGVARQASGAEHELPAGGEGIGRGN